MNSTFDGRGVGGRAAAPGTPPHDRTVQEVRWRKWRLREWYEWENYTLQRKNTSMSSAIRVEISWLLVDFNHVSALAHPHLLE